MGGQIFLFVKIFHSGVVLSVGSPAYITEQSGNISHSQTPSTYVNYFVCDL